MRWRWDQGRLDYFRFDMIKQIASVLCALENANLRTSNDPLLGPLVAQTGLSFAAGVAHKVWRNYKRVFGCCMLAADVDGKMICTELCHRLAAPAPNDMSADEYFGHIAGKFYYPSPVFEGFSNRGPQIFPVSAVLKFLLTKAWSGQQPVVTVDEVLSTLVANNCTGVEPIAHYKTLHPRSYAPAPDEKRQTRELLRFISQLSFLKWVNSELFLDVEPSNLEALVQIEQLAQPIANVRKPDPARELLELGKTGGLTIVPLIPAPVLGPDIYFSEGKPKRVTHLRYERSPKLREMYFRGKRPPFVCDMCVLNLSVRYPWTENLLELHHLLPLASPLRIESQRTSLSELVPICPSCHKATHIFYRDWLDDHNQDDFESYDEASAVYQMAKVSAVSN